MSVVRFERKTKGSAARVGAMVDDLKRATKAKDELDEKDRIRQRLCTEAGWAIQKMYTVLGIEETDKLIPWVASAKREEFKVKLLKQTIKGFEGQEF